MEALPQRESNAAVADGQTTSPPELVIIKIESDTERSAASPRQKKWRTGKQNKKKPKNNTPSQSPVGRGGNCEAPTPTWRKRKSKQKRKPRNLEQVNHDSQGLAATVAPNAVNGARPKRIKVKHHRGSSTAVAVHRPENGEALEREASRSPSVNPERTEATTTSVPTPPASPFESPLPEIGSNDTSNDTSDDTSGDTSDEDTRPSMLRRRNAEKEYVTQLLAEIKAFKKSRTRRINALKCAQEEQTKTLEKAQREKLKALKATHKRKVAELENEVAELKDEGAGLQSQIEFYERFLLEGAGISEGDLGTSRIRVETGIASVRRAFLQVSDLRRP